MSIKNAFNYLINIHSREVVIKRPGTVYVGNIRIAPSNYFRHLQGPEESVIEGREFIISKINLESASFPIPKRGDRLEDPELGISVISEVRELYDFGGALMGFRVRTS
jgi:hypothetical protein